MNSRPNRQLWLPLQVKGELGVCDLSAENPTEEWGLMERIVAPENLRAAYGRVMSNKGAPGIDGMTVESLARICGRSGPPSAGVCSREHTGPPPCDGTNCPSRAAGSGCWEYRRCWTG